VKDRSPRVVRVGQRNDVDWSVYLSELCLYLLPFLVKLPISIFIVQKTFCHCHMVSTLMGIAKTQNHV